ncbi:hypothetical protein ABAC402_06345 [Asticcacaulis sp. AC402]|nr:hypothetical protein ABAC402_06345 [Asticcacaulis sp. AC402]
MVTAGSAVIDQALAALPQSLKTLAEADMSFSKGTRPATFHTNCIRMPKTKDSSGYVMPVTTATCSDSPTWRTGWPGVSVVAKPVTAG